MGKIEKLEEEVGIYSGIVKNSISDYYNRINNWLVALSILLAIFGLLVPYFINRNYDKIFNTKLENLQAKIDDVSKKAQKAQEAVMTSKELKKQINEIKATVEKKTKAAEEAAKRARVSQIFSEALSETNPQRKIELYTKVIELNPQSANAYCNRGAAKVRLEDFSGAINDYNKAIELNPQDEDLYYNRGNAKSYLKSFEGALNDYSKAIELNPQYAKAYCNRGIEKAGLKDFEGAFNDFNKAIELNPDYKLAYKNRAVAYNKLAAETEDKEKKKEYLDKAKADAKMAKSLEETN